MTTPPACEVRSRRVAQALLERMGREYTEPLELKKLARESGLNASYLSTVFACEAGRPFEAYLTALRVEHAQALLGDAHLPISCVARKVGYATRLHMR